MYSWSWNKFNFSVPLIGCGNTICPESRGLWFWSLTLLGTFPLYWRAHLTGPGKESPSQLFLRNDLNSSLAPVSFDLDQRFLSLLISQEFFRQLPVEFPPCCQPAFQLRCYQKMQNKHCAAQQPWQLWLSLYPNQQGFNSLANTVSPIKHEIMSL